MKALLIFFDLLGISLSFVLARMIRSRLLGFPPRGLDSLAGPDWWVFAGAVFLAILIFALHRLYDEDVYQRRVSQLPRIGRAFLIVFGLLFILSFLPNSEALSERRFFLPFFGLALPVTFSLRLAAFPSLRKWMTELGIGVRRVAVVGPGKEAAQLGRRISDLDGNRYRLVGLVTDPATLQDLVREKGVDEIFLNSFSPEEVMDIVCLCRELGVRVNVLSDVFADLVGQADVELICGLPLVRLNRSSAFFLPKMVKRASDITVAGLAILLMSPVLALISIGIKLTSKGPVLFRQKRLGMRGKGFVFYKFRSMFDSADPCSHEKYMRGFISDCDRSPDGIQKMTQDLRVTKLGHFLRKSSLDELPQLINVLKGEMSLVGPRPPIPYEVEVYKGWHRWRLRVKPGMTGLWQVSGRSSVSFNGMVALDIYYAENWSLGLDFEILSRTIPMVVSGKGAY